MCRKKSTPIVATIYWTDMKKGTDHRSGLRHDSTTQKCKSWVTNLQFGEYRVYNQ